MATIFKAHIARQKMTYVLLMLVVAMGLGIFSALFTDKNANANVSSVSASDTDTANYGIDGRDVSISWTNQFGSAPTGYLNTAVYVLPASTALTSGTINTACGGPCSVVANLSDYSITEADLPPVTDQDSAGDAFATGTNYIAHVFTVINDGGLIITQTTSSPFQFSFDMPTDMAAPFIDHFGVPIAEAGTSWIFHALVFDEQTSASMFNDTGDGGSEILQMRLGTDVSSAVDTTVTGTQVLGDIFQFQVPTGTVPSDGNTIEYYLVATDRAGNSQFVCNTFDATTEGACQNSPFVTESEAGTEFDASVTGTTRNIQSQQTVGTSTVFVMGAAKAAVTSDGSGEFTLSDLPENSGLDLVGFKEGYCEGGEFVITNTGVTGGVNVNMGFGDCLFVDGNGGGNPFAIWTAPFENSPSHPVDQPILVAFDQPLNQSTISASSVQLAEADGTPVTSDVTYCPSNLDSGCSALHPGDQYVIVVEPSSDLATNTTYSLKVNQSVTSEGGQPIEGNSDDVNAYVLTFSTGGGVFNSEDFTFGQGGLYFPPFVVDTNPGGGQTVPPNISQLTVTFNEPMGSLDASDFSLVNLTTQSSDLVTNNSNVSQNQTKDIAIISTGGSLTAGEYDLCVKDTAANQNGIAMFDNPSGNNAFCTFFVVGGNSDSTAPTFFPFLADNATGVGVGTVFEFGASEALNPSSVNASNVQLKRGSTTLGKTVFYDPGFNSIFVVPDEPLAPNQVHTVTITTNVQDLAGNASESNTYTYTTGGVDTGPWSIINVHADDYFMEVVFSEPMESCGVAETSCYANNGSVMNLSNFIIMSPSNQVIATPSEAQVSYEPAKSSVAIEGLNLTQYIGQDIGILIATGSLADLSGNTNTVGVLKKTEVLDPSQTFGGNFGGVVPSAAAGQQAMDEGFGSFTGEQFAFGQADVAFPFNPMAGQDSNVFQVFFTPEMELQDNDIIRLTFPNGTTGLDQVAKDTFSPFSDNAVDFGGPGSITWTIPTSSPITRTVDLQVDVTGTLDPNYPTVWDLRNIVNPPIPKDFSTGGYTITIEVVRANDVIKSKTSMPYFISEAGSNSISLNIYANSTSSPDNVAGTIFAFADGPAGPMDKNLSMSTGFVSHTFSNLPDGCYFFGTDPFVQVGGNDYFGQFSFEPVCVESSGSEVATIVLNQAGAGNSVDLNVNIQGVDFGGADIDIFAGGPGAFTVTTLENVGDTTGSPATATLKLSQNGYWFVGVGPALDKTGGNDFSHENLQGVPPPPIDVVVSGIGGSASISPGFDNPVGVTFNDGTDTVTFGFTDADKTVTGTVQDDQGNALQGIEVGLHSLGFGGGAFTQTNASGTFSLSVGAYGTYELFAFKDGLPPVISNVRLEDDGGGGTDVYFKGDQITGGNPLILKVQKPDYYISGKLLDENGNAIPYAPVFGTDANGNTVFGGSENDGSYTLFVANGTWTVRAELPPSESDSCGTFQKVVVVSGANKTSQNISPSETDCKTVSGLISVDGTGLANTPVFLEPWDSVSDQPLPGEFKMTMTDSDGNYSAEVAGGGATYRVGTWSAEHGEMGAEQAVGGTDVTVNVSKSTSAVTVEFTGGTSADIAFIEFKNQSDKNERLGKQLTGLNSSSSISVKDGETFEYFIDVKGFGVVTGTATGGGDPITVDLSVEDIITVTGTIRDADDAALAGALVTFEGDDTTETVVTDENGMYTARVREGSYDVSADLAGYVSGPAETVEFSTNTAGHDFGGSEPDQTALTEADRTIEGIMQDNGGTAMSEGFVWATHATSGVVVSAEIDSTDGSYSLPVTDGEWTVSGVGPGMDEPSTKPSVTVDGSDETGNNFNLTADAGRVSTSSVGVVAANQGGTINDTSATGIKVTAGPGILETGSGNVTLNFGRESTAPETEKFFPLDNALFTIEASGSSNIKDLNGNVEMVIDYSDIVDELPAGTSESDLEGKYWSNERGEWVNIEGGCVIDTAADTMTCMTNHFTGHSVGLASLGSGDSGGDTGGSSGSSGSTTGSGSSGSSLGSGSNPPIVPEGAEVTPAESVSESFEVGVPGGVTIGGMSHTVTVDAASSVEVTVTIQSDPVTVTLADGWWDEIDTNTDSIDDLRVTYNGLDDDGMAMLQFENLTDFGELENAMTVNAGAYETDSRDVTVSFNVENASLMVLSNSNSFEGAFESFEETVSFTLTEGDGEKTVYAKLRSEDGGEITVWDKITLTGQGFAQAEECALAEGGAYKYAGHAGVYYITEDCTKRAFRSADLYFSYFDSWDDVATVDESTIMGIADDALGFMPLGPNYEPLSGTLMKVVTDPKVYLLVNNSKYWITSEEVFNALGYAWDWIEDVAQSVLDKFEDGMEVTDTDSHTVGSIIMYDAGPDVYRLDEVDGDVVKRHIVDEATFESLGYRWDRIIEVPETEVYPDGDPITL